MRKLKEVPPIPGPAEEQRVAEEAAEVLFDLLLAQKRVSQSVAKEFGLTLQQLAALRSLSGPEGVPMSALADALSCDAANVTAVVDKLEARGLVPATGGCVCSRPPPAAPSCVRRCSRGCAGRRPGSRRSIRKTGGGCVISSGRVSSAHRRRQRPSPSLPDRRRDSDILRAA